MAPLRLLSERRPGGGGHFKVAGPGMSKEIVSKKSWTGQNPCNHRVAHLSFRQMSVPILLELPLFPYQLPRMILITIPMAPAFDFLHMSSSVAMFPHLSNYDQSGGYGSHTLHHVAYFPRWKRPDHHHHQGQRRSPAPPPDRLSRWCGGRDGFDDYAERLL